MWLWPPLRTDLTVQRWAGCGSVGGRCWNFCSYEASLTRSDSVISIDKVYLATASSIPHHLRCPHPPPIVPRQATYKGTCSYMGCCLKGNCGVHNQITTSMCSMTYLLTYIQGSSLYSSSHCIVAVINLPSKVSKWRSLLAIAYSN